MDSGRKREGLVWCIRYTGIVIFNQSGYSALFGIKSESCYTQPNDFFQSKKFTDRGLC